MRDVNLTLAGLLLDMASLAGERRRGWGYKQAAKAVLQLDRQITPLVEANTLRAVPGIGPTTDRIAREVVYDGTSAFVEGAIAEAGKQVDVAKLRALRRNFLSRAAVRDILSRPSDALGAGLGSPSRAKYRGDFQMHSVWSDGAETLEFADIAIAHARLAAIPQDRVINYWPEKKFLEWARGAWDR